MSRCSNCRFLLRMLLVAVILHEVVLIRFFDELTDAQAVLYVVAYLALAGTWLVQARRAILEDQEANRR